METHAPRCRRLILGAWCALLLLTGVEQGLAADFETNSFAGYVTNGAAVFKAFQFAYTNRNPWILPGQPLPTNRPAPGTRPLVFGPRLAYRTNLVFEQYVEGSLNYTIWTNFIARTNGRSMLIWSNREHPIGWPFRRPVVTWNTNSLLYGMKGFTALSPCWEGEGNSGQVPVTALTRRHGYTRGHAMGPSGFNLNQAGKKVWFLTSDNRLVEVKVLADVVRVLSEDGRDYTLLLFDRDLPSGITPMRVASEMDVVRNYVYVDPAPRPFFQTEQGGYVSAGVPGFTAQVVKGGDSGSPDMVPLPGELIFFRGRTTSGPSLEMQKDMDKLCRDARLDPAKYQMNWVDLAKLKY